MIATKDKTIWTPDKPYFNCFTDVPREFRHKDKYDEFINVAQQHPAWASRYLIGTGQFDLLEFQYAILDILWQKAFPILLATRGGSKSFMLAVYAVLKALLSQTEDKGEKIIIVGSAFRQSKMIFDECVNLIKMSPLILETDHKITTSVDRCQIRLGNSYIIAVPLGTGEKIRGYRATIVIADEFASIPQEIFEVVVRGFTAVSRDPAKKVRQIAKRRDLVARGLLKEEDVYKDIQQNQIILAGTANYEFNHFYKTYQKYKIIIDQKVEGEIKDLENIFGAQAAKANEKIDYKNYAIIQLPYTALPEGFMDKTQLGQARLTMSEEKFDMEYMAKFITDTKGFFKRSKIEICTPGFIESEDGKKIMDRDSFAVELGHDGESTYVIGIDPARSSKGDNFAICVAKIHNNKIKIVYIKTFRGKDHIKIAETIRLLVSVFKIQSIGIDTGGGGQTFADILANPDLSKGKELIFDKDDEQYKNMTGRHIIELVNYQGDWLRNANHDLQADFDHQRVLFPYVLDEEKYIEEGLEYEGSELEQLNIAQNEIEEAKDEICSIVVTVTGKSSILHFDLPDIGKNPYDTRRKDRYSAVLIATDQARKILVEGVLTPDEESMYGHEGDWVENI